MRNIDGYDVVVSGGGPGGFAAAVASGRSGAKTLLLEREGCLGGGMTTMLVHPFMPHRTGGKVINAGIFKEVVERAAEKIGDQSNPNPFERNAIFDDEAMKVVLDELATEAGVDVIFHATVTGAEVEGDRITAALFAHNGGPLRVTGNVFIDGTGDAVLADLAGCQCEFGNDAGEVMPMTLNFLVGGIDLDTMHKYDVVEMIRNGDNDTPKLINTHFSCSSEPRPDFMQFNMVRLPGNTLDPVDLSKAEMEGRRRVENFMAWAKANVPGFENAYLAKTASHMGIRESRRVVGDYVLSEDDFTGRARFDDAVCCCSYDIDIHGSKPNEVRIESLKPGEYYQIPYRCLTPLGKSNMLMAARSISPHVVAHSSMRIMPVVMTIGQAAGIAAAMAVTSGDTRAIDTRSIDITELQKRITTAGGILEP